MTGLVEASGNFVHRYIHAYAYLIFFSADIGSIQEASIKGFQKDHRGHDTGGFVGFVNIHMLNLIFYLIDTGNTL